MQLLRFLSVSAWEPSCHVLQGRCLEEAPNFHGLGHCPQLIQEANMTAAFFPLRLNLSVRSTLMESQATQDWPQLIINQPHVLLSPLAFKLGCSPLVSGCQTQLLEMWCHSKAAEPSSGGVIEQLRVRCGTFCRELISSREDLMAHIVLGSWNTGRYQSPENIPDWSWCCCSKWDEAIFCFLYAYLLVLICVMSLMVISFSLPEWANGVLNLLHRPW